MKDPDEDDAVDLILPPRRSGVRPRDELTHRHACPMCGAERTCTTMICRPQLVKPCWACQVGGRRGEGRWGEGLSNLQGSANAGPLARLRGVSVDPNETDFRPARRPSP